MGKIDSSNRLSDTYTVTGVRSTYLWIYQIWIGSNCWIQPWDGIHVYGYHGSYPRTAFRLAAIVHSYF